MCSGGQPKLGERNAAKLQSRQVTDVVIFGTALDGEASENPRCGDDLGMKNVNSSWPSWNVENRWNAPKTQRVFEILRPAFTYRILHGCV